MPLATCKGLKVMLTKAVLLASFSATRKVSPAEMPAGKAIDTRMPLVLVLLSVSERPLSSPASKSGVPGVAGLFRFWTRSDDT